MQKTAQLLARIDRSHYWLKMPEVVDTITFNNRTFFSKYRRIAEPMTDAIIKRHLAKEITVAHSIIREDDSVTLIAVDYNGDTPQRFYHHSGAVLSAMKLSPLYTFHSKSASHLHLYIECGHLPLQEAIELGKIVSRKLEEKLERQWKVFPTDALPRAYNIINLPYEPFSLSIP